MATADELQIFKAHCRADDFDADDQLLALYLDSAKEFVLGQTGRSEEEMLELGGGQWPRDAWVLCMAIGAHFYAQPEAASAQRVSVEPVSDAILKKYRVFQ